MTATDVSALIAAADLSSKTERLMLSDELEMAGRMAEAVALRKGPCIAAGGAVFARCKPFSARQIIRRAAESARMGRQLIELASADGWMSDRRILFLCGDKDRAAAEAALPGLATHPDDARRLERHRDTVREIIGKATRADASPLGPVTAVTDAGSGITAYVFRAVRMDGQYYETVRNRFPRAGFRAAGKYDPVQAWDGTTLVALIMPLT